MINLDNNNHRIVCSLLAMLMIMLPASMLVAAELETAPVAINLDQGEWGPPGGGAGVGWGDPHPARRGHVVIPGKINHSWDVPEREDVVILVRRAGPADFNFVPAQ